MEPLGAPSYEPRLIGVPTTADISVHVDETLVPAPNLNWYYIATRRLSHRSSHAIPHTNFDDVEERERGERKTDRLSHAFTRNLRSTQQTTYTMSCLVDLYNSLTCAHKKEYYELHGNNNSYNGCGVVS
jgi:hypothetical protein